MIYELRLYSVATGRLDDVYERFGQHVPALFERHGVTCVGSWKALVGNEMPRYVYLLAYRDFAEREAAWASFYADPDWWRIRAETNAGHEMVERYELLFLKPNPAWEAAAGTGAVGGVHELQLVQVAPGQTAEINRFLTQSYLPQMQAAGAQTLGVFDMVSGPRMPQLVMLHAWPDAGRWHEGRRLLDASDTLRAGFGEQRARLGYAFFLRGESQLLEPAPWASIAPALGRRPD